MRMTALLCPPASRPSPVLNSPCTGLTIVLGLRWQVTIGYVAAFPRDPEDPMPTVLLLSIELLAVVALLWIWAWQPEARGRQIRRLAVVLWGTTAFGEVVHIVTDYMIIGGFGGRDTPPTFGYLTVATITISAILTVIMTLRAPKSGADDEPHEDHDSGSLTLA
jgi:hypothetical protein